mmetsp:Transcript_35238/g.42050  ORF Transcript_35238/g.42050 Transcript_35238/m.42050 type:complete len:239 (+) Transcript_35238:1-717(+)
MVQNTSLRNIVSTLLIAYYLLNNRTSSVFANATMFRQAFRMIKYDRASNERNAIPALNIMDTALSWYRLDDGVMGGQSQTTHSSSQETGALDFKGEINTSGGGFTSIRSKIANGLPADAIAIRLTLTGDGKTYKLMLSDGSASRMGSISWQADIPTEADGREQTVTIRLSDLKPSSGPRKINLADVKPLIAAEMKEIGVMLSLKLSDGSDNPKETFGEGIFDFTLKVLSIEPVSSLDN